MKTRRAKSSREMRRAKQRQDRNLLAEIQLTSKEELRLKYFRNGITDKDVQKAYEDGLKDGREITQEFCFHSIYAAFLIVMAENGIDSDKAVEWLKEIDRQAVLCVDDEETAKEAYEKSGVELVWDDALERVHRKG